MMVLKPVGPTVAAYYLPAGPGGRWLGDGASQLGLGGAVTAADLTAVLQGRHPGTDRFLPRYRPARRRAGWDLVFSAPKSVSLLAATAGADGRSVADAHQEAVGEALRHLGRHLMGGSRPMVAAAFDHDSNAAAEPHLHTHVLLANLSPLPTGGWGPCGQNWWTSRHTLSAVYQLGLRHHLAAAGWDLDWRIRPDGLADLAAVPRAAVRAASTQRASTIAVGPFQARRAAAVQPWRERAAGHGLVAFTRSPSGPAPGLPALPALESPGGQALEATLSARLAGRASDFRQADVLMTLAGTWTGGATADAAQRWVEQFCSRAIPLGPPSPTRSPRWTTGLARDSDRRLAAAIRDGPPGSVVVVGSPAGRSNLLAHAALLNAWRKEWIDAGLTATVKVGSGRDGDRWRALTGLAGDAVAGRADVVIIDQADRQSSPQLLTALAGVRDGGGRAVLLEGGTLPRLTDPRSGSFVEWADETGRLVPPASAVPAPVADLVQAWARRPDCLMVGLGVDETRALNSLARAHLPLTGPALEGRAGHIQCGDRVVALGRVSADAPLGTLGSVAEVRPDRREALVRWDSNRLDLVDRAAARHLGYGYAVTPSVAQWTRQPLVLLGSPRDVGQLRDRVVASVVAPAPTRWRGQAPVLEI